MKGQIVFITDGSPSAKTAGETAIAFAIAMKLPIKAVFILEESWRNLLGDEWMSAASTRSKFFHWLEDGLRNHWQVVLSEFSRLGQAYNVEVATDIRVGKTEQVIIELTEEAATALLVLPNPHATAPAAAAGLRFNVNRLTKKVKCPILLGAR